MLLAAFGARCGMGRAIIVFGRLTDVRSTHAKCQTFNAAAPFAVMEAFGMRAMYEAVLFQGLWIAAFQRRQ